MKNSKIVAKKINIIVAIVVTILISIVEYCMLNPTFYTNDQVLMRDIVSGQYTGKPDGHLVYILYPLGLIFSLLYRIFGTVPWYDLFMWMSFPCACGMLFYQSLCFFENKALRWILSVAGIIALSSTYLYFLVQNEYTVNAGIWGAVGIYSLILTLYKGRKNYMFFLICFTFSLWLRKEVFFMLIPFAMVIVLWRIVVSKSKQAIFPLGIIGIVAVLSLEIDALGYSSTEWRTFKQYNEYRTQIADYYGFPQYGEISDGLSEAGISENKYNLLMNNLGWNGDLEEVKSIATFAQNLHDENENISDVKANLIYNIKLQYVAYKRSILGTISIVLGTLIILLATYRVIAFKDWTKLYELLPIIILGLYVVVFMTYFVYKGRFPERISLPLFSAYLLTLFGYFAVMTEDTFSMGAREKHTNIVLSLATLLLIAGEVFGLVKYLPQNITAISDNKLFWDGWISRSTQIEEYAKNNPNTVYYIDGSVGNYKCDYMVNNSVKTAENTMNLGFWTLGSPLMEQRKENLVISNPLTAIADGREIQWIVDSKRDVSLVNKFFAEEMGLQLEQVGKIESPYGNECVYAFR